MSDFVKCDQCTPHQWHGLPCKVCPCPTAFIDPEETP